ncbi:MAG: methionyl-tRNA formyltransferase [Planctomycetota bacterium]
MSVRRRIVFLGSGAFGLPTLEAIAREHELVGVVTQPDRPAGRGGRTAPTPIGAWAASNAPGVPLLKPERINRGEDRERVRGFGCDAWVVIAFGQKLGAALLEDRFAVNLHASLLPRWRGAAPINAAVIAGDRETGNSVITLAERMDAGEVLGRSRRPIEPHQTAGELHDLLAGDGPALVMDVLTKQAAGELVYDAQDEALVTLAGKLGREDAWVDLARPAVECRDRVHGLMPWPGVSVRVGEHTLKLGRVEAVEGDAEQEPGRVADPRGGLVATGRGMLRFLEVQPAGKKMMVWSAFVNGREVAAGAPVEPLVAVPGGLS